VFWTDRLWGRGEGVEGIILIGREGEALRAVIPIVYENYFCDFSIRLSKSNVLPSIL
jgi:hypothetical protein